MIIHSDSLTKVWEYMLETSSSVMLQFSISDNALHYLTQGHRHDLAFGSEAQDPVA